MDNHTIANKLSEYAAELDRTRSDLYRVRAYRHAADVVRALDEPLLGIFLTDGRKGLKSLPGIGRHIAFTIEGLLRTGEFRTWRSARNGERKLSAVLPRGS